MIHPTAVVSSNVKLGKNVIVGPYCVIRDNVVIGDGTTLDSHVCVGDDNIDVQIGQKNHFFSHSVIGGRPQDLSYKGEKGLVSIGDSNTFREYVTVNAGTLKDCSKTVVGSHNLIMAYVHIAHDCHFGNHIAVANLCQFAGHVIVEDHVKMGGAVSCTQRVRLGKNSYIAGKSALNKDVLPYTIAEGYWAKMRATNKIGLEREGFSKDRIQNIHKAIRSLLKGHVSQSECVEELEASYGQDEDIHYLIQFIQLSSCGMAY